MKPWLFPEWVQIGFQIINAYLFWLISHIGLGDQTI